MSEEPVSTAPVEISRVTVEEVMERVSRGEPLAFVDSRSEASWNAADSEIPGSIRVPPDRAAEFLEKVPKDRSVITYCTWTNEASSARVARELMQHGWKDVHALHGGYDAWRNAGGETIPKKD